MSGLRNYLQHDITTNSHLVEIIVYLDCLSTSCYSLHVLIFWLFSSTMRKEAIEHEDPKTKRKLLLIGDYSGR